MVRSQTNICPSAQPGIEIPALLKELVRMKIYKNDYETITSRILEEPVSYEIAVTAISTIAESGMFEEKL